MMTHDGGLKGVFPTPAYIMGMLDTIVAGLNATDNNDRPVGNNHVSLNVTVLVGSGVVVVTGDSVNEASEVVTAGDTENITVDATGRYQTTKKWWRITNVTIPGGITGITYAIEQLGYWDWGNNDFEVTGYRAEATPTNAALITFQLQIYKVQDDGDSKWTLVPMEDIVLEGGGANFVDDNLRAGGDDRTYNASTVFKVGIPAVLKNTDFSSYFSSDENICESSTKNEGIIFVITWDNVDYYSFRMNFKAYFV